MFICAYDQDFEFLLATSRNVVIVICRTIATFLHRSTLSAPSMATVDIGKKHKVRGTKH